MAETRKLAAILAADVVGFSRLAGADEDRTLARLRALRSDLIDPTIAVHHGRVVKRTGDGALVEFRSVVDGVRCAVEIQNAMVERNAGVSENRRIEFRIGIHIGDVVEESDGDLMGDGVNIAARLEGVAGPGAICLSEDAYRQVKARLDLAVADLGPTELKNIAEPIRVYSLQVGVPAQAKPVTVPTQEKSAPPRLSIVVLPFKNLSGDSSQDYFADGVTENLTTDLSRIRNSFVIARNTAFTFKDRAVDAKQIARELGVRYVLEGSVQRDQNRVRVNAQLIDGETGAHLWADRFQEDVADLFKLQDDVVARLANPLSHELVRAEAEAATRSKNPDSLDLVMRGRGAILQWVQKPPTKNELVAVRALFERALEIDPKNADALAGSASTYVYEYSYGWTDSETDYDAKILGSADRSIALSRDNAWAYGVKSIYLNLTLRPSDALRVANAGLALTSNNALLFAYRAAAENYLGQFDEAKTDLQQAMRLSPRDPRIGHWHNYLADAEIGLGHLELAIDAVNKAMDAGYRVFYSYLNLAAAHALKGDMDHAKAPLAEARRLNPKLSVKWLTARKPILQPAFEALRNAGLGKTWRTWVHKKNQAREEGPMVSRRLFLQSFAAVAAASQVRAAWAANAPGVTDAEIKIGQTWPYSGPASGYVTAVRAEAAYFKMVNDKGGVNGRRLNLISLDDGYSAPKTVEQTRRLIEEEGVAFIFQAFGGFTNLAVRPYLNENKVPQLFGAAGADQLDDPQNYPWTIGFNPATTTEGRVYAKHILAAKPDAKIGVLYQNDVLGKTILAGVRDGLGSEHAALLVKEASYELAEPAVDSQVITLQGAGVDTLIIAATSKAAAQTIRKVYDLGWTPERYLFFGAASIAQTLKPAGLEKAKGLITAGYVKDPTVPRWQDDPGFKEWEDFATKYMSPTDVREQLAVYGFTTAATMVHVLEQCRDDLSRENILRQALAIKDLELPMLLPGIKINTSPDNYFLIRQLQLERFNGEIWDPFGELISG